jgi:hypothetical protein
MQAIEDAAARLAAAGASVREIVLPEEFSRLYHAARETINNYERSKSHAADWASDSGRISRVLGDRIRLGLMKHADYIAALRLGELAQRLSGVRRLDAMIALASKARPAGLGHTGDPAFQQLWTALYGPDVVADQSWCLPVGFSPSRPDTKMIARSRARWLGPAASHLNSVCAYRRRRGFSVAGARRDREAFDVGRWFENNAFPKAKVSGRCLMRRLISPTRKNSTFKCLGVGLQA